MSKTGAAFFALQEIEDAETHQNGPSLPHFEAPTPSDAAPRRRWIMPDNDCPF